MQDDDVGEISIDITFPFELYGMVGAPRKRALTLRIFETGGDGHPLYQHRCDYHKKTMSNIIDEC